MLANTSSNAPPYWGGALAYNTEALLEDVSRQMAAANLTRRLSRGSTSSKAASRRVVKTTGAGISPRNSITLGRRRTLMSDGPYRRRPAVVDQTGMAAPAPLGPYDRMQPPPMPSRPVSWHATSHLAPQAPYQMPAAYPHARLDVNVPYQAYDFVPTSAAYSGYASPSSTFSPLSQPWTDHRHQSLQFADDFSYQNSLEPMPNQAYLPYQSDESLQVGLHSFSTSDNMDPSMYSHFDWDNFATNGFADVTAPPTPDDFLPIQRPDPSFESEELIPYHSLDDSDEPGEVLVGMGLYDAPEKSPTSDPQLDAYRSTMMTQLLGQAPKKLETPAMGKGLKLEETWNPPPSDHGEDEDGEGEDEDDDAEGSEADEPAAEPSETFTQHGRRMQDDGGLLQINHGVDYCGKGWL